MIRRTLIDPAATFAPTAFRHRGKDVSRIEGFSDAVFGFALTLLVVSLQTPETFEQMIDSMKDSLAFGVCFALLIHFWYRHFMFFRQYGLSDMPTMLINSALLFVLLMYVYPLRFMFSTVITMFTGIGPKRVSDNMMSNADVPTLFVVFGAGYAAIYILFGLLYIHAYRVRQRLALGEYERHDTVTNIWNNLACAGVGFLSIVLALTLNGAWVQIAGWCYATVGFVAGGIGYSRGRSRERLQRRLTG